MIKQKRCIGHGVREGTCQNRIDSDALALNRSGLWCVECEKARRKAISAAFAEINASFSDSNTREEAG